MIGVDAMVDTLRFRDTLNNPTGINEQTVDKLSGFSKKKGN